MRAEMLLLRLEVLKRGVQDVQAVLEAGKAAPAAIQAAKDRVDNAEWFVSDVVELAENEKVLGALTALRAKPGGEFKNELKKIDEVLAQVRKQGAELSGELAAAKRDLKQIDDRSVHFTEGFGSQVGKQTSDLARAIEDLISEAQESTADGLWKKFSDEIQPKATTLFAEYLDLLGGVSIRERGLTLQALADVGLLDDFCLLADWHFANELTLCLDWDQPPHVAIPGQDEATEASAWPILRLGFASWSIWGLPLEGHEFGKLLAETIALDGSKAKQWAAHTSTFGKAGTRLLIADTIATWAEGPAYGCALLFLVLNPERVPDDPASGRVSDRDRAQLVLSALDRVVPQAQGGGPRPDGGYHYLSFLEGLRAGWDRACEPSSAAVSGERVKQLDDLARLVQRQLTKPFSLEDWRRSATVLDCLQRNENVSSDLALGVRHLTNAAWRGRLADWQARRRDDDTPPVDPGEIERRALKEGMALIKPRPSQVSGGNDPLVLRDRSR